MPVGVGDAPLDDDDPPITPGEVKREVRDFVRAHERRRRQFPRAFLVGLITGIIAVCFRGLLNFAERWRDNLFDLAHNGYWWGLPVAVLFGAIFAGLGVALVPLFAPEASGSGIPHLKSVLHRLRPLRWKRVLPVKFVGGFLAIGAGLTLGREGPTVQMGGAIGQMISEKMGATARERQNLIAAGAGAGLAAAFNAPLAGLVFVLEEVQRDFAPGVFAVAFVACVTGDVVSRVLLGQLPVFHVQQFDAPPLSSVPLFLFLGIIAGAMGVVFNRALLWTLNLFTRARSWKPGAIGALVGGALAVVGVVFSDDGGQRPRFGRGDAGGQSSLARFAVSVRRALQHDDGELCDRRGGRHFRAAFGFGRANRARRRRNRPDVHAARRAQPRDVRRRRHGRLLHRDRARAFNRHRFDRRNDR